MLSSHRIPVLTRAHSIVLPEHLPEISDIGEPRVIRDFRYRTVFFPEQLCRILQPHGADIVSRGMAGERLQLVEKSGAAHVLHATEHVHTETGVVDILHDAFPYGGHEFPVPGIVAVRRNLSDSVLKTGVCPSEQCPVCQYVPDIRPEHVYAKRFGDIGVSSVFQPLQILFSILSGIVLLLLPKGGLQTTVMFALAAWLVIYGLFLTRRLLRAYHRVIRIFDDTRADDIGAYIKWLSIFTYWAVTFGVGCGLLTFLPDEYVYIWILSSVPFYIYLFLCYLNYLLFYEQVENAMEDGMTSEEEDLCDTTNREQAQRQDTPFFHAEIAKKIKGWIDADGYIRPGLTIKELSDVLHTNRTYLSGYIKTTYDMSFRDWIIGLRIEYAKRLLARYPRLTIADISEKSGFLSPSHFIRLFKENAGCTPVKWRKTEAE